MSHKILERIKTVLAWFNLNDYAYFMVTIFSGISSIYVIKKSENFSLGLLTLFCFVIGLYYSYRIIYKACKHAVARELFKKGSTKLNEGDFKGAIKAYQRLIDLPEWHGASVPVLLSYALFAEGLFEQVISVITQSIDFTEAIDLVNEEDYLVVEANKLLGMSKVMVESYDLNEAYGNLAVYLECGALPKSKDEIVLEILGLFPPDRFEDRVLLLCNKIIELNPQGLELPKTLYSRGIRRFKLNKNDLTYMKDLRDAAKMGHELATQTVIGYDKFMLKKWTNNYALIVLNVEESSDVYKRAAYTDDDDENKEDWHIKFLEAAIHYFVMSQVKSSQELCGTQLAIVYANFYVFTMSLECVHSRASLLQFIPSLDVDMYDYLIWRLLKTDQLNKKTSQFYNTRLYDIHNKRGEGLATLEARQ